MVENGRDTAERATPSVSRFCPNCGTQSSGTRYCTNCGTDLARPSAEVPLGPPPPETPPRETAPPSDRSSSLDWGGVLFLIAGGLVVLGSFLPWISATAAFIGTISRNGIDGGDGVITVGLGILTGLFGVSLLARSGRPSVARVGALFIGLITLYLALVEIGSASARAREITNDYATGQVGAGLYVIALGAILAIIAALSPLIPRGTKT